MPYATIMRTGEDLTRFNQQNCVDHQNLGLTKELQIKLGLGVAGEFSSSHLGNIQLLGFLWVQMGKHRDVLGKRPFLLGE